VEDLIVVTYNNQYSAVENMQTLRGLDFDWVVDIRDAVAVTRDSYGKLHIQDSYKPTTGEGVGWGVLLGTMLGGLAFAPFTAGMSTAAATGAVAAGAVGGGALGGLTGAAVTYDDKEAFGISEDFVSDVSATIKHWQSALFVLAAARDPEEIARYFRGTGGTIILTRLSPSEWARAQQILNGSY
jgi:uncharacterized membrane protein